MCDAERWPVFESARLTARSCSDVAVGLVWPRHFRIGFADREGHWGGSAAQCKFHISAAAGDTHDDDVVVNSLSRHREGGTTIVFSRSSTLSRGAAIGWLVSGRASARFRTLAPQTFPENNGRHKRQLRVAFASDACVYSVLFLLMYDRLCICFYSPSIDLNTCFDTPQFFLMYVRTHGSVRGPICS